ncbi:8-amino-7-oxononanoate synthase [Azoarcus olearius]|uniref:8-amino-7-oxononanoate synthase n=1 Tax=Azoarcus sp. (strain BH72) TaxID=418699 RepID=BIOF_AZOSB|nr:8-amino-7-oxononanoate synthase [Azoarcus olearius]A1K6Q1.1 RecName: Full=8-amino-7-oxononanoate synthase; Short=AONS; AltName: Full=7-keto-8-amino-pelargonic acid synthase; Short=7-KAP synthase; Short=KAPA synthase; AltName: Full=8-amino-7-ketopelargonate synthase [Azoarcus olearius]CAL94506.1 8-amino-7-oxononanoate synthase [Azoarcus olearius]
MSALLDRLRTDLSALAGQGLRRVRRSNALPCAPRALVDGREMLAFCSNDYLGLAAEPALATALAQASSRWGAGSGASHLVSGHYAVHDALEHRLAAFVGAERALYFSTGYMANAGIVPALVGRGDAVFADRLNHASLVDGVLLSRADMHRYPHGDLAVLARQLAGSSAARKLIVTDAVFSMDGDVAPLADLLELAERHDAWLMVDDAHGFGVLGPQGRGALADAGLQHWRLIYVGTLGKAAGVSGAFAAGHGELVEWLLQKARTYIFTTGAPPALAEALLLSLDLIEAADDRRTHLAGLIERFGAELTLSRWQRLPSRTPIQPIRIGGNEEALAVARALWDEGLWVPAIRPPTVPAGSARLRVSLTAAHTEADVLRLARTLNRLEHAAHG